MVKNSRRIFPRYIWKIIVACTLLVILLGMVSYRHAKEQMQKDLKENLSYCLTSFNNTFNAMAYAGYTLELDPTVSGVMHSPLTVDPYDYRLTLERCEDIQAQLSSLGVSSINLYQEQAEFVFATGVGKVDVKDYTDGAFLQSLKTSPMPAVVQRTNNNNRVITLATGYSSKYSANTYGYLCFNLKNSHLENQLSKFLQEGYSFSLISRQAEAPPILLGESAGYAYTETGMLNSYYLSLQISYPRSLFLEKFIRSFLQQCVLLVLGIAIVCTIFLWSFRSFRNFFGPILFRLVDFYCQSEDSQSFTADSLQKSFNRLIDDRKTYEEQLLETHRWMEEKGINFLLQGIFTEKSEIFSLSSSLAQVQNGTFLVACIHLMEGALENRERVLLRAMLKNIFTQTSEQEIFSRAVDMDFESIGVVSVYPAELSPQDIRKAFLHRLETMRSSLPKLLYEKVFVSVVCPVCGLEQIPAGYQRAKANLIYRHILMDTHHFFADTSEPEPDILISPLEMTHMISAIRMDRLDVLENYVKQLLDKEYTEGGTEWYKLKSKIYIIVSMIFNQSFLSADSTLWEKLYEQAQSLGNARNEEEILLGMKNLLETISQETLSVIARSESGSHYVYAACRYIEENYDREIAVGDIAQALSLNVKYLSRLFKQHCGQTMTQYISALRLKKAIALLETTSLPIHSVGEQVGFHDVRGFIRLFKKQYGITPSEYRLEKA